MKRVHGSFWDEMRSLWKQSQPSKSKMLCDQEAALFWNTNKFSQEAVNSKIQELKLVIKNYRGPLMKSFERQLKIMNSSNSTVPQSILEIQLNEPECDQGPQETNEIEKEVEIMEEDETVTINLSASKKPKKTHAQNILQDELNQKNKEKLALFKVKELGMAFGSEQQKQLNTVVYEADDIEKRLKKLKGNSIAAQKSRKKKDAQVQQQLLQGPSNNSISKQILNPKKGRPALEREQPGIQDAILSIVSSTGSAHERRRCELLRCCMRLKDLLQELKMMDFNISKSGLYLRLLPRSVRTLEGKRHINTVPVKLLKPRNSLRKNHQDTHFAAASVKFVKDLACFLGEACTVVISQDDKARVPLGIPAAHKQGPILMKVDYMVLLPDHDFAVGVKHKLIVSVYGGVVFENRKLTYSGPTSIYIRSGKHDSSTAKSHSQDLGRILNCPDWDYVTKNDGIVKPVIILLVDGGPDENPRNPKVIAEAISNFRRYNLDGLFVATHAPGQSASNPVERRMAPLSRDLCGLILPHDHFGSHLSSSGKTLNLNLEKKNFTRAGIVLANVWNEKIIDNHPVFAQFVLPPGYIYEEDIDIFNVADAEQNHFGTKTGSSGADTALIDSTSSGADTALIDLTSSGADTALIDSTSSGADTALIDSTSSGADTAITETDLTASDTDSASSSNTHSNTKTFSRSHLISTPDTSVILENVTEEWKAVHVRQSQYFLQITKCKNTNCCSPPRTSIFDYLINRFIPAPVLMKETIQGPVPCDLNDREGHFYDLSTRLAVDHLPFIKTETMPYDLYCPSMNGVVAKQTCPNCQLYFPTQVAMQTHKKAVHTKKSKTTAVVDEAVEDEVQHLRNDTVEEDGIYFISDMDSWLSPVFTEDNTI